MAWPIAGAEEEIDMIRRRMNPAGTYAGLSNLILISALSAPGYPRGQMGQAASADMRAVRPDAASGRTDDAMAPARLDATAI